ncbi:hypothetical protein GCM10009647_021470 [Streptomyces sanglieri]
MSTHGDSWREPDRGSWSAPPGAPPARGTKYGYEEVNRMEIKVRKVEDVKATGLQV